MNWLKCSWIYFLLIIFFIRIYYISINSEENTKNNTQISGMLTMIILIDSKYAVG